jgi:hypothetical protein
VTIRDVDHMAPGEAAKWYAKRAEKLRPEKVRCRYCLRLFHPEYPGIQYCCESHRYRDNTDDQFGRVKRQATYRLNHMGYYER